MPFHPKNKFSPDDVTALYNKNDFVTNEFPGTNGFPGKIGIERICLGCDVSKNKSQM